MNEEVKVENAHFERVVWEVLSRIDTSDHVDVIPKTGKRPEVSYLSWSKAWMLLKRNFPASTYTHRPDVRHPDGTVEVEVDVNISDNGAERMFTNARLAVMDNWFNPIDNPTARQVNDARQRTLVKALAFAGLGLNLWSDSSIPVGELDDPISLDQIEMIQKLIESTETDEATFLKWCKVPEIADIPIERYRSAIDLLEAKARRQAAQKAKEAKK